MTCKYSKRVYNAVAKADQNLLGVRLGAACIDAQIPAQVVAKWFGISRQGVYYWFKGVYDVDERHREKANSIIGTLLRALDDRALPAKDLETAMAIVKQYREKK